MAATETMCLKWNDFHTNFNYIFRSLRNDTHFTDVTLVCEDGHAGIKVHSTVLLASSTFFKNILKGSIPDQHWIYLEGTRQKDLSSFVDLLYYGYANINEDACSSFLEVAKEFNINDISVFKSESNPDFSQNIQTLRKSHNTRSKDETYYSECNSCGALSFSEDHKNKHYAKHKEETKEYMSNQINPIDEIENVNEKNLEYDKSLKKHSGKRQRLTEEVAERDNKLKKYVTKLSDKFEPDNDNPQIIANMKNVSVQEYGNDYIDCDNTSNEKNNFIEKEKNGNEEIETIYKIPKIGSEKEKSLLWALVKSWKQNEEREDNDIENPPFEENILNILLNEDIKEIKEDICDTESKSKIKFKGNTLCDRCEKYFTSFTSLYYHKIRVHCPKEVCPICSKEYSNKKQLKEHNTNIHEDPRFQCSICQKHFRRKSFFKIHKDVCGKIKIIMKEESKQGHPKKQSKCQLCLKIFKTQSNLKKHTNQRHNQNYPCFNCPEKFPSRSTLSRHKESAHGDELLFNCPQCPATFARNSTLNSHKHRTHRDKMFQCKDCDQQFKLNYGIKKHRRTVHPEIQKQRRKNK